MEAPRPRMSQRLEAHCNSNFPLVFVAALIGVVVRIFFAFSGPHLAMNDALPVIPAA